MVVQKSEIIHVGGNSWPWPLYCASGQLSSLLPQLFLILDHHFSHPLANDTMTFPPAQCSLFFFFFFFFFFLSFFMAALAAYGGFQARDWIRAAAAGLHHSHSNADPSCICTLPTACSNVRSLTHWSRPGIEPAFSWTLCQILNPLSHNGNSCSLVFKPAVFSPPWSGLRDLLVSICLHLPLNHAHCPLFLPTFPGRSLASTLEHIIFHGVYIYVHTHTHIYMCIYV